MKSMPILLILLLAMLMPACTGGMPRPSFARSSIALRYDDFGPDQIASMLLGPRGTNTTVVAHYGFSHLTPGTPDVRYINVLQGMNFLKQEVSTLPPTPANDALRQRLRSTYARLYPLQRQRYDQMLGSSFAFPQNGMSRRLMLPALPPPTI